MASAKEISLSDAGRAEEPWRAIRVCDAHLTDLAIVVEAKSLRGVETREKKGCEEEEEENDDGGRCHDENQSQKIHKLVLFRYEDLASG